MNCSPLERLLRKVEVTDSCWLWKGAKSSSGYGNCYLNGRYVNSHVAFYMLHHGPVPKGMQVMHACNNKLCVNPEHLSSGTPQQNTSDAFKQGLVSRTRGGSHHKSKLSNSDVREIRGLKSALTYAQIAEAYQVAVRTVAGICQGKERIHHGSC